MPDLELTPNMVGPERTRLTLAYIECIMLWPLEPEKRSCAFESARAANMRQLTGKAMLDEGDKPITFSEPNELLSLLDQFAEAMPLRVIHEDARLPFGRGMVVAHIFIEALLASKAGGNRYLQQIKSDVIKRLLGKPNVFGKLSPSTVENLIWSVFRSVVHLWGAFYLGLVEGDLKFPCSLDKLPRFLATSEALRLAGELCPTRQRRTLLDPAKTLRVPQDVPLPKAGILRPRQSPGAV